MNRRRGFRLLALALGLGMSLVLAEGAVRFWQGRIRSSDVLAPGMVRPDSELGWVVTPNWQGRHRHHDFEVEYRTSPRGFRADGADPAERGGRLVAVVGDSFTFGLGVNDDETFVAQLKGKTPDRYMNCAVPGTSTDQQVLLVERQVLRLKPAVVLLMVYVGNDLFDNQLAYPLQVNAGKPYFVLGSAGLELKNVPVPGGGKPREEGRLTLNDVVLGAEARGGGLGRSRLVQLVRDEVLPAKDYRAGFATRFEGALELFFALLKRLDARCKEAGCELRVGILAGRSFIEEPASVSGQFQEYLRGEIVRRGEERGYGVLDVAGRMRAMGSGRGAGWFHPHDGHLTRAGHVVVAEILIGAMTAR